MAEDIFNPNYWKIRIDRTKEHGRPLHHSIFVCNSNKWEIIEEKHKYILSNTIKDTDNILDCGCGYGRLLELLPRSWKGRYLGVDLSPDLVRIGLKKYPRMFLVGDLRELDKIYNVPHPELRFDWAILVSIKHMVIRNLGNEEWTKMLEQIKKVAKRILYLEYDTKDDGNIEIA